MEWQAKKVVGLLMLESFLPLKQLPYKEVVQVAMVPIILPAPFEMK